MTSMISATKHIRQYSTDAGSVEVVFIIKQLDLKQ